MEYTQDPKIPENVRLNDHMNIAKEVHRSEALSKELGYRIFQSFERKQASQKYNFLLKC